MEGLRRFEVEGKEVGVTPDTQFNTGIRLLNENKLPLVHLRDLAFLRINDPKEDYSFRENGTYVRESALFYKENPGIFLRDSKITNPKIADLVVKRYEGQKELFVVKSYYESHLEEALKQREFPVERRTAFILGEEEFKYIDEEGNLFIPTSGERDTNLVNWFYRHQTEEYMRLLARSGIEKMPVWLPKKEDCEKARGRFLRQIWVCCMKGHGGVKGDSGVSANNRSLHEPSKLVGIAGS